MVKVRFEVNEAGLRAVYEQVAESIKRVDTELRAIPLVGKPVDEVKAQAAAALGAVGVDLPDEKLTEYAQSISDGDDFEFVLT